jgi:hypothetical protein
VTHEGKKRHHSKPMAVKHIQRSLDPQTFINWTIESIKMVNGRAISNQILNSEFSLKVSLV